MRRRITAGLVVVAVLGFLVEIAAGVTKIAPEIAEIGEPFTIVDAPAGRLADGSVAVFRMEGLEVVLPLRTRRPFNTAHGQLAAGMFGGLYMVSVRPPVGAEIAIGPFTVIGAAAPAPSITPVTGVPGEAFTITDALARIEAGDLALFYAEGADPGSSGVPADNVVVSADGTTLSGNVPFGAARDTQNFVAVRPSFAASSRFEDLGFFVTHPPAVGTLYTLVSPDGVSGPNSIAGAILDNTGSLAFFDPPFATSGTGNLNATSAAMAASPDGSLVFVGHNTSDQVEVFSRQPDGSLVSANVASGVEKPQVIKSHPALPIIYVASGPPFAAGEVQVFSYTAAGVLSLLQTVTTGNDLRGIAVTSSGSFLVTSHIGFTGPKKLDVYAIDALGMLSGLVDSHLPAGAVRLSELAADPAGGRIYVQDLDMGIYVYEIDFATGALTPLNGDTPYPMTGVFLADLVIANGTVFTLSLDAGFLVSHVEAYPIEPGGLGPRVTLTVVDNVQNLTATSDGSLLFATSRSFDLVHTFSVSSPLALTEPAGSPQAIPGVPAGAAPGRVILIPIP